MTLDITDSSDGSHHKVCLDRRVWLLSRLGVRLDSGCRVDECVDKSPHGTF